MKSEYINTIQMNMKSILMDIKNRLSITYLYMYINVKDGWYVSDYTWIVNSNKKDISEVIILKHEYISIHENYIYVKAYIITNMNI